MSLLDNIYYSHCHLYLPLIISVLLYWNNNWIFLRHKQFMFSGITVISKKTLLVSFIMCERIYCCHRIEWIHQNLPLQEPLDKQLQTRAVRLCAVWRIAYYDLKGRKAFDVLYTKVQLLVLCI